MSIGLSEGALDLGFGDMRTGDTIFEQTYLVRWKFWSGWGRFEQDPGVVWTRCIVDCVKLPRSVHVSIFLWPFPLILWIAGTLLLRSGIVARRRALTGTCIKCGYSLAGLAADAPCPECGKTKTKASLG